MLKFFQQMAAAHDLRGTVLVLDNHRAHHTEEVIEFLRSVGAEPLFLPPASSIMNPIEVLWASVKRRWRQDLMRTAPTAMNQTWMERTLVRICTEVANESLTKVANSHLKEARFILQEAIQFYDGPSASASNSDASLA